MTAWNLMLKKVCKQIQKKYSTMDATILKELLCIDEISNTVWFQEISVPPPWKGFAV